MSTSEDNTSSIDTASSNNSSATSNQTTNTVMSTLVGLNVEYVEKYIQTFTGKQEELSSFLHKLITYDKKLRNEDKNEFLEYVVECKIHHNVRARVSPVGYPNTLNELVEKLNLNYIPTLSVPQLLQKIYDLKQGYNQPIRDFGDKMSNLLANFNTATLLKRNVNKNSLEGDIIMRCNEEHAFLAYKKGLNAQYSQTVQAAQPKTFEEARTFAENLILPENKQQVLYTQQHRGHYTQRRSRYEERPQYRVHNRSYGNRDVGSNNRRYNNNNGYSRNQQRNNRGNHNRDYNMRVNNQQRGTQIQRNSHTNFRRINVAAIQENCRRPEGNMENSPLV
ncbi:putative uncharacterized protein DDB_G0282129 [Teleopsis dalmanni]|uniref:putative uncharacterized protein DDB_G0282129 n=1 Tax=Teleopsis dalmanni TaxID=139649 RepID=UPI0018CEA0E1|nr:putative uncharacterized protein DDB_G0282129 [Teleopsis dalmanni]